jgi:hypothetical protein
VADVIPDWLQQASDLDDDAGLDIIFNTFHDWFEEGEFEKANSVFAELDRSDIESFSTVIAVGLLSATVPAAHLLPARDVLGNVILRVVADRGFDPAELRGMRVASPEAVISC